MSAFAVITAAGVAGLAVTFLLGFAFVPFLGKLEFGNTFDVREKRKPVVSSGGIMLAIGTVSAVVLAVTTDRIAGGDIAGCKGTVAWAARSGRNAAENIMKFLENI